MPILTITIVSISQKPLSWYYHDTIRFSQQWSLNMANSRKNEFWTKQLVVIVCILFDLTCLNVVCLLAIKMALSIPDLCTITYFYILIIINFEPYSNAGYTDQYLCPKGAWQEHLGIGQFGK